MQRITPRSAVTNVTCAGALLFSSGKGGGGMGLLATTSTLTTGNPFFLFSLVHIAALRKEKRKKGPASMLVDVCATHTSSGSVGASVLLVSSNGNREGGRKQRSMSAAKHAGFTIRGDTHFCSLPSCFTIFIKKKKKTHNCLLITSSRAHFLQQRCDVVLLACFPPLRSGPRLAKALAPYSS
jgi:hypothetical protein